MKKILVVALSLVLIFVSFYYFQNKDYQNLKMNNSENPGENDGLRLFNLLPNALISSPIAIMGEIPGTWYFEGSFSVVLIDDNDMVLGSAIATAQSDSMTTEPVIFTLPLNFNNTNSVKGYLVLEKANPSDLEENNKSIMWPVRFK
jgi:hypothetical protein